MRASDKANSHVAEAGAKKHRFPLLDLKTKPASYCQAPDDEECFALWDKYAMFENVRRHSLQVARIATSLAERALSMGFDLDVKEIRASALLHDLAKTWCLQNGGSHALLGASWVIQETRHYRISQGVALHVDWPWPLPEGREICCLPLFIIYADKRVRHDTPVSLDERFEDLLVRYGKTQAAIDGITRSHGQAKELEKQFSHFLQWNLHEHTFANGRLV